MKRTILLIFGFLFLALTPLRVQAVEYYLPYPGLLPDHPLYWAKMIRDRVELLVTFKSETRAEKLLTYADKRLGAGWALVDGGKIDLGVSTLTKAEKYLEQAIALKDHLDESRLNKAIAKHAEVLRLLKDKAGDQHQAVMTTMLERLDSFEAKTTVTVVVDFGNQQTKNEITVEANNALEALQRLSSSNQWPLTLKQYDFGALVESIGDVANNKNQAWIYFVNGQTGQVAADQYQLKSGDKVEWHYLKPL